MVEVSGPFLAISVLEKIFPQGLISLDTQGKRRLRSAYDEWRDAIDENDPQLAELHQAWCTMVLKETLEFENAVLYPVIDDFTYKTPDGAGKFSPDLILRNDGQNVPLLLISILPNDTDLEKVSTKDSWPVPMFERMTLLCRERNVRFGLITNGERWMLVNAPVGNTSSHASWYARLWFQEPITLKAFQSLLSVRRWFGPQEESLSSMLEESLLHQEEVTDTLGEQVKRAVEVLVQCLDKADQDRNRELLHDVAPSELYEAGLTVMMRLVFILCAEERGLLLLGDPVYDQYYALTTLRGQLSDEADQHGHEVLERRYDAWARLLAVSRVVFGGIAHETLRMPALGGSLFDPDRFPFLEGRSKGTCWNETAAQPLPIDNRTVLLLLEALQVLEQSGGALLLSYKALDVEQIGHVYEGLLEHTVRRLPADTLGLSSSQKAKNPNLSLAELESAKLDSDESLITIIENATQKSRSSIVNALAKEVDDTSFGKVVLVCGGDLALSNRIKPFTHLLRTDAWGNFIVYRANSFAVTLGTDRRETGTHYTPKFLTETIVETTLEPVVYIGPAEGKPREEWHLKSSSELLELKICDPAMGSGAFLVQVCRWLSELLVEAWGKEAEQGKFITLDGVALESAGSVEPMPFSLDERLLFARRLVAEKCLYGVDLNPLAVELAKLSIWLITLAKGRPFGFLDHNLRSGNSLLGIMDFEQIKNFTLAPKKKWNRSLFSGEIDNAILKVIEIRKKIRSTNIIDISDIKHMESLDAEARAAIRKINVIADAMIGEVLIHSGKAEKLDAALFTISAFINEFLCDSEQGKKFFDERIKNTFRCSNENHIPFHWCLNFPEVFEQGGFDAIVANPPWGASLSTDLLRVWKDQAGQFLMRLVDSFHLFTLQALELTKNDKRASIGLILPDVILYQSYSSLLRKHLLSSTHLIAVSDLKNGVFNRVNRPSCALVFSKNSNIEHHANIYDWESCGALGFKHDNCSCRLIQKSLIEFPGHIIPTTNFTEYSEIVQILHKVPSRLSDFVDSDGIQRGVSADNKEVFVISQDTAMREGIEENYLKPVIVGGVHLSPFQIQSDIPLLIYTTRNTVSTEIPNIVDRVNRHSSLITCSEVKDGKHPIFALHRPREEQIFTKAFKLVGVITADRPKIAVDKMQRFTMDGTFVFGAKENVDPYYLAGVLNSDFLAKIYRVFSQEEGRLMAQVKPTVLQQLPIVSPVTCNAQILEIISKITKLSIELHQNPNKPFDHESTRLLNDLVEQLYTLEMKLQTVNESVNK